MNLVLFEQDRDFIVQPLRHGQMDYLEPVTEALDADLFRQLLGRQILQRLAETFPTPAGKRRSPSGCTWPARSASGGTAPARRKLLPKIRELRRGLYRLLENARAP